MDIQHYGIFYNAFDTQTDKDYHVQIIVLDALLDELQINETPIRSVNDLYDYVNMDEFSDKIQNKFDINEVSVFKCQENYTEDNVFDLIYDATLSAIKENKRISLIIS